MANGPNGRPAASTGPWRRAGLWACLALLLGPGIAQAGLESGIRKWMRSLYLGQEQFKKDRVLDENGNGVGEYGTLRDLAGSRRGPYVPQLTPDRIDDGGIGALEGYLVAVYLPEDAGLREENWVAYAWPETYGETGFHVYAVDPSRPPSRELCVLGASMPAYAGRGMEKGSQKRYSPRERIMAHSSDVEHNGDIYPRDFYVEPAWKLGSIMESSWEDLLASPRWRAFGERESPGAAKCETCGHLDLCAGDGPRRCCVGPGGGAARSRLCEGWKRFFDRTRGDLEGLGGGPPRSFGTRGGGKPMKEDARFM